MPDIIQESYNIVNHFLGEDNGRGQRRVPEKHEALISAIQTLVAHAHSIGKVTGAEEVRKQVTKFADEVDVNKSRIDKYPKYVPGYTSQSKEEKESK